MSRHSGFHTAQRAVATGKRPERFVFLQGRYGGSDASARKFRLILRRTD